MAPSARSPHKLRAKSPRSQHRELPSPPDRDSFSVATWEPVDLSQALVIIGFPSVGLVGTIATAYLADSLRLREVGAVLSPVFPPTAVIHDGIGSSPVRVFMGDVVCGPDGSCEQLCVIQSSVTPKSAVIPPLAYSLVSWARAHGARQVVCLEGLKMEDAQGDEARILGIASDLDGRKMLDILKVSPQADSLLVGFGGVLLYAARAAGQPALCLLAETREEFPDARGAARLLEVLQPLVPLVKIDERPLLEQARILEVAFREQINRSKRAKKELAQPTDMMFG